MFVTRDRAHPGVSARAIHGPPPRAVDLVLPLRFTPDDCEQRDR